MRKDISVPIDISIPTQRPNGEIKENLDLYNAVSIFNTAEVRETNSGKSKYVGPAIHIQALVDNYQEIEQQVTSFTKANLDAKVVTALCNAYNDDGMIVDCPMYRTSLGSNFVHFAMLTASITSFQNGSRPLIAYRSAWFGESIANRVLRMAQDGVLDVFEFDIGSKLRAPSFWSTSNKEIRGNRGYCIASIMTFSRYLSEAGIKFSIVGIDLPALQYMPSERKTVEKGMAYMIEEFMSSDNGLMIEMTPEVMMSSVCDKPIIELLKTK